MIQLNSKIENILLNASIKAAIESSILIGAGNADLADAAATNAMRQVLSDQDEFLGKIVIGEGERDEAPMLYIGEELGRGSKILQIAVDPLEGTNLCANNLTNSTTVIAAGVNILNAPDVYMKKISVKSNVSSGIDVDAEIEENIHNLAKNTGKKIHELNIVMLDRPRHKEYIEKARKIGAKVSLIQDGDVNAVILSASKENVDMYFGIGGAPEGVLASCALKTLGGFMQTRLICEDKDRARFEAMSVQLDKKYEIIDMSPSDSIFIMTGVTNGDLCTGVVNKNGVITTQSLVVNSENNTIQKIEKTVLV